MWIQDNIVYTTLYVQYMSLYTVFLSQVTFTHFHEHCTGIWTQNHLVVITFLFYSTYLFICVQYIFYCILFCFSLLILVLLLFVIVFILFVPLCCCVKLNFSHRDRSKSTAYLILAVAPVLWTRYTSDRLTCLL